MSINLSRYVRQESVDWDLLHAGTITGSTILGATGLCHDAVKTYIPKWPLYLVRTALQGHECTEQTCRTSC